MKKIVPRLTLIYILLCLHAFAYSQVCTGCTINISGQTTLDINVFPGNTLCIAADGDVLGDIINYGGTVCNLGQISGDYIQHDGTLNNYNLLTSGSLCVAWKGVINNYGTINSQNVIGRGSPLLLNNEGDIYNNEIDFAGSSMDTLAILDNHGSINTIMFHTDTSLVTNYGTLHTFADIHINEYASFISYGILNIDNHYFNNGYSQIYCMANVGGDLYNNGQSAGPAYGCGGYSVDGSAFNNGVFGIDEKDIDLCKTSGPSGFDGSLGTIGTNVTYCSCTENCEVQFAGLEEEIMNVTLFPNPVSDQLIIQSDLAVDLISIYDLSGRMVFSKHEQLSSINVANLNPGFYRVVLFVNGFTLDRSIVVE